MEWRFAREIGITITVLCSLLWAGSAVATPNSLSISEARRRFQEGVAAYDAGKFEASRIAFAQAYALEPLPELLINLGHAELKTDRYVDGARHISKALREAEIGLGERRAAERALQRAEEEVARIKVAVNIDGATIRIDGEDIGASPMIYVWHLEPGEHRVRVSKDGFESDELLLGISKGKVKVVQVRLKRIERVANPTPLGSLDDPLPGRDKGADSGPSLVPVWIGGGLAVAGVAVGVVFSLDAASKRDDRDSRLSALSSAAGVNNPCATGAANVSGCSEVRDLDDKAASSQTLGIVGFAVGGAALIGTVTYALLASGGNDDTAQLTPLLGPQLAGLSFSSAF